MINDKRGEFVLFLISNGLALIVNFHTPIPDCDASIPPLFGLFPFSEPSVCYAVVFSSF